ncbi:MAG: histidine phosphatase family protein [Acidimicrobiia bacterium]|nr:histidine phosphatase family protein [Acidimicrobiia bacterium]
MPRILLVRHGQSEWNAEGRWQGQADIALSDLGRAQARAATTKIGSFDVIASSTLMRAAETAYIISSELGIGPIVPVPELIERSAGEWSGLTKVDIERDWPGYLEAEKRPPNYESDDELWARIEAGMQVVAELLPGNGDEALVVAHGGLIYLLEDRVGVRRGRIPNLGALWVDVANDGTLSAGERVELIDEGELSTSQSSDIL